MSTCCSLHDLESPCGVNDVCCLGCDALPPVNLPGFLEHQIRLAEFLSAYVCPECGSVTTSDVTWQLHVRAHEMEAEASTGHQCDTGHFDRTLCPEPCDTMHSYCSTCDKRQDACAFDAAEAATEQGDDPCGECIDATCEECAKGEWL